MSMTSMIHRATIPSRRLNIMNDTKQSAKRALTITTVLTLFVAGAEILIAYSNYKPGMNFLDITSYVTANKYIYYLILIIANMVILPSAVLMYKQNGISLKDEIYSKQTLGKDIFTGFIALAATEIIGLLITLTYKGRTDLAYQDEKPDLEIIIMGFIALGLVSGIVKEILFRGLAKRFCAPVMGETTAMILFNTMFAMLDWYNYGYSFLIGLVWIWAYKKSGHLIAPMIAHGGSNIIAVLYLSIVS